MPGKNALCSCRQVLTQIHAENPLSTCLATVAKKLKKMSRPITIFNKKQ
jgi:hypothetical protein